MKNTRTIRSWAVFAGLMLGASIGQAYGQDSGNNKFPPQGGGVIIGMPDPKGICVIPKIDGDKVPFPLKSANTKFELAESETYLLNGFITPQDGKLLFKVDFDSQPWLATQKRTQFPYFLINASDTITKRFDGALVQMAVVVRKSDVSTNGQEWDSSMVLDVITTPVIINQ